MNQSAERKVYRKILWFFFPLMTGMLFQQLYAMADSMIVGHFLGKQALAAVGGTAASFINLIVGFFTGISAGATVVISHLIGEGDLKKVRQGVENAVIIGAVGGLLFMLLGLWASEAILEIMLTPKEVFDDSLRYMRIYMTGMIPSLIYNIGSGVLRAAGDVKHPLYYLIFSCIVNIVLDYVLVAVIPFGIVGAAAATMIAQWLSAVCICAALKKKDTVYAIKFGHIRLKKEMLLRILSVGLPAGLQSLMYNSANMIIQTGINSLGTNTVAAWSIYNKADGIFGIVVSAFGTAAMTFTGQSYGARQYENIHRGNKASLFMCGMTTITLSVLFMAAAEPFFAMFTSDGEVIVIGKFIMYFLAPFQVIYIFAEILSGVSRGMGKSVTPMVMTFITVCVLRIMWMFLVVPKWKNVFSVLSCFPITWIISSTAFIIYSYKIVTKRTSPPRTP